MEIDPRGASRPPRATSAEVNVQFCLNRSLKYSLVSHRMLRQFMRQPHSIVDRPDFEQGLHAYLSIREASFLVGRLAECRVTTKRAFLVVALLYGQEDDHQELIRLALGLCSGLRNWRVLGYLFRQLQVEEVLRVQPEYAEGALSGTQIVPTLITFQMQGRVFSLRCRLP